jgi:ketosteroid isomerase-like protein
MSAEGVELVRESFRRWESGEFDLIESFWHEECRITAPEGWPEAGPFVGRAAVAEQLERLAAGFEQNEVEVKEISDHGDWVVVDYEWRARGTGSGIENRMEMAAAFRVEDRRFSEGHYRWSRAEALKAAGLD